MSKGKLGLMNRLKNRRKEYGTGVKKKMIHKIFRLVPIINKKLYPIHVAIFRANGVIDTDRGRRIFKKKTGKKWVDLMIDNKKAPDFDFTYYRGQTIIYYQAADREYIPIQADISDMNNKDIRELVIKSKDFEARKKMMNDEIETTVEVIRKQNFFEKYAAYIGMGIIVAVQILGMWIIFKNAGMVGSTAKAGAMALDKIVDRIEMLWNATKGSVPPA